MATAGLVITVPPMNNGLQLEIAQRLQELDSYAPLKSSSKAEESTEAMKIIFIKMLRENGVNLLLRTLIVDAYMKNNTICGVIIENKSGRGIILAKVTVDATGDADVAAFANAPFEKEKFENILPVTLMFNMVSVNLEELTKAGFSLNRIRDIVEEGIKTKKLDFKLETKPTKNAPGVYAKAVVHEGK